MLAWYVVNMQPQKEWFALDNLIAQGYEVYCPSILRTRKHARKVETVKYPLFPRYAFVHLDKEIQSWRSINGTRGVVGVLCQDGTPSRVPDSIIQKLKSSENDQGCVSLNVLNFFKKGDKALVRTGAFEGQEITVMETSDNERVKILLQFLGREMVTEVRADILQKSE